MNATLARLEFRLEDEVDGQPITPATVDLPTLRGFLEDVEKLIKGDVPGASLADSRLKIEEGSVRLLAFVAASLASSLTDDVNSLASTGDLDQVQPKRAEVFSAWQARARKMPNRIYFALGTVDGGKPLRIDRDSQIQHLAENAWVAVEKYVTGKVMDMGGKSPNVHLQLPDRKELLTISATEQQLAGKPHLFHEVTLRISAEQHLHTKELRDAHMIEFLPVSQEVDEGALTKLWEKGRTAWQHVAGATAWVEEIRGH